MRRMGWLDVDLSGLEKLLTRRSKEFIVYELIQNAWDEESTMVEVSLPRPDRSKTLLVVKDDSPHGFRDLSHAFTLFAHSYKRTNASQRGMFNAGEKFVLAFCEEACITSTSGGIFFGSNGRRRLRRRTDRGSEFSGLLRLSGEDWSNICDAVQKLIPPVTTIFNGKPIVPRNPIHIFGCKLPTLEADEQGELRRKTRATEIRIYDPHPGETAMLYEMGIPIVATGDKWHVDVQQKVPLNLERDNVSPAYLQSLRVAVVNELSNRLSGHDAGSTWVRQAAGDERIHAPAFDHLMDVRFGEKRVTYDPSDPEANLIATSRGYAVVGSASLSGEEWKNVRRFGSSLPAGRVTPSPKPFSLDGKPLKLLDPVLKMMGHSRFEVFACLLAQELLNKTITIAFADDAGWAFRGCYGNAQLTINIQAHEPHWFNGSPPEILERWVPFLIHELAHDRVHGHLSDDYHRECCRLAGILARLAYSKPELFAILNH
jgi:hypothetical protein